VPVGEYTNLSVKRFVREELDRLRSELGVSDLNDLLILLVRTYREYTNTVSKTVELLTNIASKVDELLTRLTSSSVANPTTSSPSSSAPGIGTNIGGNIGSSPSIGDNIGGNIGGNIGTSTPSSSTTNPPPTTARSAATTGVKDSAETYIWCRKKSEIRNFKGFLEWVDHSFGLVDWWEEGEKYCFETRRSPKQEKGKKRGRGGGGG
jgi:hypothetical protein